MFSLDVSKISDSRVFFIGALLADTACTGSLAVLLFQPASFAVWSASKLLLVALSITMPPILVGAFLILGALREKIPVDERARRAILLGCATHGFAQLCVLMLHFQANKGFTLKQYFAWTAMIAMFLALVIAGMALNFRQRRVIAAKTLRKRKQVDRRVALLAPHVGG